MSNFTLDLFSELTGAFETVKSAVNSAKTENVQNKGRHHQKPMGHSMAGRVVQGMQPDGPGGVNQPFAKKKASLQAAHARSRSERIENEASDRRAQLRNAFVMAEVLSPPVSRKRHSHKSMLRRGGGNL